jgi:hypothetical protein
MDFPVTELMDEDACYAQLAPGCLPHLDDPPRSGNERPPGPRGGRRAPPRQVQTKEMPYNTAVWVGSVVVNRIRYRR